MGIGSSTSMGAHAEQETKTVLIVEDDTWLRSLLMELLVDEGYQVLEAADGAEALELVEREGPDVVVLDLHLPWKSGLEVLHELRVTERTATLPVLVVSGALDYDTRAKLSRRGERANGVLEKPLDVGRLFDEVENVAWPPPHPTDLAHPRTDPAAVDS